MDENIKNCIDMRNHDLDETEGLLYDLGYIRSMKDDEFNDGLIFFIKPLNSCRFKVICIFNAQEITCYVANFNGEEREVASLTDREIFLLNTYLHQLNELYHV